jgi:lipoyl(octanoyl) transferase
LGTVEHAEVQRLQRRLSYELGEGASGGAMILCEHPPVITVGRSGSRAHIVPDDASLAAAGVRVRWVNRGGGCVLHLPGQLCVYLMLPLRRLGLSVQDYLVGLQRVILGVLAEFDLRGTWRDDAPGVYLGTARVATVGVSIARWITAHGMTLNVGPYLRAFDLIDEPGLGGATLRQTSMESRRQRPAPMAKVRESVIRTVETVFGLGWHHVYTDHPLVGRKAETHAYFSITG